MNLKHIEYNSSNHPPSHAVVLLHGYGSHMHDLISLAPEMLEFLPQGTLFISIQAPFECEMGIAGGWQWFSLRGDLSEKTLMERIRPAEDIINDQLKSILNKYQIKPKNAALVGFSQGAMMALHCGLRQADAWAAIVGYSGRLLGPTLLKAEHKSKPNICLIHGSEDLVVPPECMQEAKQNLSSIGITTHTHLRPKLGHGIDLQGIDIGANFINDNFKHLT